MDIGCFILPVVEAVGFFLPDFFFSFPPLRFFPFSQNREFGLCFVKAMHRCRNGFIQSGLHFFFFLHAGLSSRLCFPLLFLIRSPSADGDDRDSTCWPADTPFSEIIHALPSAAAFDVFLFVLFPPLLPGLFVPTFSRMWVTCADPTTSGLCNRVFFSSFSPSSGQRPAYSGNFPSFQTITPANS